MQKIVTEIFFFFAEARRRLFLGSPGQRRLRRFHRNLREFPGNFWHSLVRRDKTVATRAVLGTVRQV